MAIDRTPFNALVDDVGDGVSGSIWNKNQIKNVLLDPIDAAEFGSILPVPFVAGNFTASGSMTWTVTAGQVLNNQYTVCGKVLMWTILIINSTIGGTLGPSLIITVPGGFSLSTTSQNNAVPYCVDGNGSIPANPFMAILDATHIRIAKNQPANAWTAGAGASLGFTAGLFIN